MNKKSNMYDWISGTWNPIAGKCSHVCSYCSTKSLFRYENIKIKYSGPMRLDAKAMFKHLGNNKTWFVAAQNDLFSEAVGRDDITQVLAHCRKYPFNQYVFQTKNPERILEFLDELPEHRIIGTTIETNRAELLQSYSQAPDPIFRAEALAQIPGKTFITIEPIMKFNLSGLMLIMELAHPSFINIGADSKYNRLPEPEPSEIICLKKSLQDAGYTIKEKHNLSRITNEMEG